MSRKRVKEPVKEVFTRAEVLAAVAGVYAREQEEYHRMAERAREASYRGEAALYVQCDELAEKQRGIVAAVRRVSGALGLSDEELNTAANAGQEVE